DRFNGKPVIEVPVKEGIHKANELIQRYLIYWCSLIGSVALIYAFNALIFSDVMQELSSILNNGGSDEFSYMIIIFSFIITFI
ncbi:hypothetical protein M9Y09_18810, partial [Clostridioides difficile]